MEIETIKDIQARATKVGIHSEYLDDGVFFFLDPTFGAPMYCDSVEGFKKIIELKEEMNKYICDYICGNEPEDTDAT